MSKALTFSALSMCILLWASCKSDSTECPTEDQQLRQELAQRNERIRLLEDSLHMVQGSRGMATQSAAGAGKMEGSMYKNNSEKIARVGGAHGRYPGQFPEGSERLLATKDVENLSPWGLKMIRSEIYARHGMRFSDVDVQDHFNHQNWYKALNSNVDGKLSRVERQDVAFLKSYKFSGITQ